MPSRKSNVSAVSNGADEVPEPSSTTKASKDKDRDGLSVEDLSLPKSMIARLAKGVLPANTQIHKDALLALHKSATVFVNYIASGANDNAIGSGKKTIAPHDVIAALKDSELEHFLPRLEAELKRYNEMQCDKRNNYRKKVKEEKAAATVKDGTGEVEESHLEGASEILNSVSDGQSHGADEERPMKKMKAVNGNAISSHLDDADENDGGDEQDADDNEDETFEDAVEDEVDEEEEEDDDDDANEETMEDALEEPEGQRSEVVDEALDDPDSD